ncbi:MAG: ABC transporter ATP-binding protein [Candidatus Undinarchaeales archaeon]|jgi:putative ABC transport system ATP-binding protein|nr:ABC transporter ATP-binding protein [Candidatus Undinarchaeales archaeon]
MTEKKIIFETKGVWKTYGHGDNITHALSGVDLKIYDNEYAALFGPSGSGKSTLMHILGCLDTPTKGQVFLEGQDVSNLSSDELALVRRNKLGFIFQAYNLIPGLNAIENVAIPLRFAGFSVADAEAKAKKMLKIVDLEDRMDHNPNELSGGQQQRVAIARALVNDPEIILADEPTGNLDTKTGDEIVDILHDLQKNHGKTILVVTHDPGLAKKAKKHVLMKDGKIVDSKHMKEWYTV